MENKGLPKAVFEQSEGDVELVGRIIDRAYAAEDEATMDSISKAMTTFAAALQSKYPEAAIQDVELFHKLAMGSGIPRGTTKDERFSEADRSMIEADIITFAKYELAPLLK